MKVEGSALHTVSHLPSSSGSSSSASLKQKQSQPTAKQKEVSTLASEGQKTGLPKNLTQLETGPSGADPGKQKNKKFSFKQMFGRQSSKSQANKTQTNTEQSTSSTSPSKPERSSGKSFTSKLAHGLGFKHSKLHTSSQSQTNTSSSTSNTSNTSAKPQRTTLNDLLKEDSKPQRTTLGGLFKEEPLSNKAAMGASGTPFREHGTANEALAQATKIADGLQTQADELEAALAPMEQPDTDTPDTEIEDDPEVKSHLQAFQARQQRLSTIPEGENEGVDEDDLPAVSNSEPSTPPGLSRSNSSASSSAATQGSDTADIGPIKAPEMHLENGKLHFSADTSPALSTVLEETLGRSSQSYVAHESHQDNQNQLLLDKQGRVFQLTTDPDMGILALHTSTPLLNASAPPKSLAGHLEHAEQNASSNGYHSVATGIHSDSAGNHWRIHAGKLHSFVELSELEELSGIKLWKQDDTPVSKLSDAQGSVLGIKNKHQLVNLSNQQNSATFKDEITSYSRNENGQLALLLKNKEDTHLGLLPNLQSDASEATFPTIKYSETGRAQDSVKLNAVHITDEHLYAIDAENNLLRAPIPKAGQEEIKLTPLPQAELENAFGKDVKLEGFTSHRDGSLSLLVRDHSNQLHGCPANDATGKTFKPGWNLSDTLHLNNTIGLEQFDEGAMQTHDFGMFGSFALDDGKLYSKDQLTQQWTKIGEKVQNVQRGVDGQAYALQDGKLKAIGIDESSAKISFGNDNVFALTQTHGSASLGGGPKGVPDGKLKAAAVINAYQHVTLTESDKLQFINIRPGTSKPLQPPREINLTGLDGNIAQLSVDKEHTLFALTDTGKLFSLAKNDWQTLAKNAQATPPWKEEKSDLLPSDLKGASISLTTDHQIEVTSPNGDKLSKGKDGWQASNDRPHDNGIRDELFNNLVKATKGTKLTKDGVQYTMTAQLGGVMGMESNKVSSKFTDRLKAHVFKPSLEMPRPIKTAAYSMQHQWQGREGLRPMYEQETALYKELEASNSQSSITPKSSELDVKTRIDRLKLGEAGKTFKADLEALRTEIEQSAEKQLVLLGRSQGVLHDNNAAELNLDYKPSKVKDTLQSLNPNRSGHNLSEEVFKSWKRNPASQDSNVTELLKTFNELKVNMSHQKADIPAGRLRDPNDDMALSKARLVLDTLTLQKLNNLVDKAELLSGQTADENQLHTLQKNLSDLRDQHYGESRIKYFTDNGMTGHKDVEAGYDIAKSFMKGFSDPEHSVSLVTRAALGSKDHTELNQDLKDLMHSLKLNDNITISRGYSSNATATFVPNSLQGKAVAMFPSAGLETKRGYDVELNGLGDGGVEIAFKGNLLQGGNANFGIRKDALPHMLGDNANDIPIQVNDHQSFKPDLVAGAGLTINGASGDVNNLRFTIRGDAIDAFVDGLTQGKMSTEELIKLGVDHNSVRGSKWNFNVDLGLNVAARARLNLTDDEDNPNIMLRAGGGVSAKVNLVSMNHDDLKYKAAETSRHRINRTDGVLNQASAGIDGALTLGARFDQDEGMLPIYANLKSAATVAVDHSVKTRGELRIKPHSKVTEKTINGLRDTLSSAFQDPVSQQILKGVGELHDIEEQLEVLERHFSSGGMENRKPMNDKQYLAINEIKSTQIQYLATKNNVDIMQEARGIVAHFNPHKLDHPGVLNFLTSLIAPSQKDALSDQISHMMEQDPTFASMIDNIRSKPNTYAWVTLQLKDEARLKLEKDFVQGKATVEDAKKLLEDPEQRRIKSISILETGQHKEGFKTPTPILGGASSASIYMEREAGVINFKYGQDQSTPRDYTITGNFTHAKPDLAAAIKELKESEGLSLAK